MAWGPAPEAADPAFAWLDRHARRFGHFINGAFQPATSSAFKVFNPANRQTLAEVSQGSASDVDAAVQAARGAQVGGQHFRPHPRPLPLRARATNPEAQSPVRRARVARQWQTHPRVARPGHPAGRPPLRVPRRLGAAYGRRATWLRASGRRRPDHPVELPTAHARLEGRSGPGHGQHGRSQAGRVYPAHRACSSPRSRSPSACPRACSTC